MSVDRKPQEPSTCISCHVLGISSSAALGAYMFYRAKQANSTTHRFTCAFMGLGCLIFASHRVSSLFKDISQQRIAATGGIRNYGDRRS